jgi:hypothetical protein
MAKTNRTPKTTNKSEAAEPKGPRTWTATQAMSTIEYYANSEAESLAQILAEVQDWNRTIFARSPYGRKGPVARYDSELFAEAYERIARKRAAVAVYDWVIEELVEGEEPTFVGRLRRVNALVQADMATTLEDSFLHHSVNTAGARAAIDRAVFQGKAKALAEVAKSLSYFVAQVDSGAAVIFDDLAEDEAATVDLAESYAQPDREMTQTDVEAEDADRALRRAAGDFTDEV